MLYLFSALLILGIYNLKVDDPIDNMTQFMIVSIVVCIILIKGMIYCLELASKI